MPNAIDFILGWLTFSLVATLLALSIMSHNPNDKHRSLSKSHKYIVRGQYFKKASKR